jgi:hypothetical protein
MIMTTPTSCKSNNTSTKNKSDFMFQVGQMVVANKMPVDSFYKKVAGKIFVIKNGWIGIEATDVMDKWSSVFVKHPTSCMIFAKIEDCAV